MDDGEHSAKGEQATPRQPGVVLLLGLLGTALLVSGLVMLPMLQAPAVSVELIVVSCALIAAGVILLRIAWIRRRR